MSLEKKSRSLVHEAVRRLKGSSKWSAADETWCAEWLLHLLREGWPEPHSIAPTSNEKLRLTWEGLDLDLTLNLHTHAVQVSGGDAVMKAFMTPLREDVIEARRDVLEDLTDTFERKLEDTPLDTRDAIAMDAALQARKAQLAALDGDLPS